MSFAKKPDPAARRALPNLRGAAPSRMPLSLVLRTVLFGLVAIGGALWALHRHYTHTPPPLRVPVPAEAPTYDADAGEIPVPDFGAPEDPPR